MRTCKIVIPPDLTFMNAPKYFENLVNIDCSSCVVIDLTCVTQVYSSLVRFLVDLKRRTVAEGGELVIVVSEYVRNTLHLVGMDIFLAEEIFRGDSKVA